MTRRIALAILAATWATLIVAGVVAYLLTRSVLLADLDEQIIARASALPRAVDAPTTAPLVPADPEDRYVMQNEFGQTLSRLAPTAPTPAMDVLDRRFATLGDGERVRSITLRGATAAGPVTIIYSRSAERFDRILFRLAMALATGGIAAGSAAAVAAVATARTALRPLRLAADAIGEIDESHLDRRINPSLLPSELHPVARRMNDMLERLEQAFVQRRRFLAEASHELRTPVAALVTTLDVALRRPRDAAFLTQTLSRCRSDATSLHRLVKALMEQVRGEASTASGTAESFDLVALIRTAADQAERLGADKAINVRTCLPDQLWIEAESWRLGSVLTNLLANAVEYNRPGGTVSVSCEANGEILIEIRDDGPGIPADVLPGIFEPFVRARTKKADEGEPHLGLGLSLVQAHVRSMGGKCEVQSDAGVGTRFQIRLPGSLKTRD